MSKVVAHSPALVRSQEARRRLDAARAWLDERAGRELLVVAPTRGAADDLLRTPATAIASGRLDAGHLAAGRLGVHRRTLGQLAAELAVRSLARDGLAPLAGLAVEALAARALAVCREDGALAYFEPVADTPGMPRALARTLLELRAHGVTRDDLEARGDAPGRDLARLLRAWHDELAVSHLDDPPSVLRRATDAVRAAAAGTATRHALVGLPLLVLDPALSAPAEAELIIALAAAADDALLTAPHADSEALERLRETAEALDVALHIDDLDDPVAVDEAGSFDSPSEPDAADEDDLFGGAVRGLEAWTAEVGGAGPATTYRRLDQLRQRLFASPASSGDEASDDKVSDSGDDDHSVRVFTAAGEGRECTEIARRLQDLARRGLPFDRAAIALRDPDTYLPLLEEALGRAGVPAYCSRGSRRPDPAGRALLALLACADERLSAARFAEYLSLGEAPDVDAAGAPPEPEEVPWVTTEGDQLVFKSFTTPPIDDAIGDDTVIQAGFDAGVGADTDPTVVAGSLRAPRQWQRLLVDAAVIEGRERWRRRLRGAENELRLRLRAVADGEPAECRRVETQLRRLRALAAFALPLVDALDALPETAPWGVWLESLESLATRALRRPERVLETLAELRPMAEVGPVGLSEVRGALEERLATLRAEPPERRWGRVFVCTLDELRGRAFDTVFVPSLAEGQFPRRIGEDPLLLDVHRRALAASLPTRRRRAARERLLLHLAVGAAETTLALSWPTLDAAEGRARVPSFYALDLLRAAEGRLPDVRVLERRAADASAARLGWPAPRDAALAVDAAEYDLAVLADLIARRDEAPIGAARYLLEANERLRRALRNRYCRWESRKFTRADGLVDADDATHAALAAHRPTARSFSPTALQSFALCPLRFLLYALHGLRELEAPERLEQMDPLTRGSLFHEVQFELLSELRDDGLLPLDDARAREIVRRADDALDRVAARYEEELAPAVPRIWRSEIESLRLDLRGWLRAAHAEGGPWTPSRFELAFGLGRDEAHDPASRSDAVEINGGRRLRGSIDLLERDTGGGRLRVTDHKTGRPPDAVRRLRRHLRVGGGEVLQPLLYALAVESMVDDDAALDAAGRAPVPPEKRLEGHVTSGRLFYCTRRGGYQSVDVPLDERGRDAVGQVLGTVGAAIDDGFFPAAPRQGACRWCDYRPICGDREERRVARKRPDRLERLGALRGLP
ncbi:MAG: PD-(D/E)XK nuclease family protein [Acidobacteriota bacterium]